MSKQSILSFLADIFWLALIAIIGFLLVTPFFSVIQNEFLLFNFLLGFSFMVLFRFSIFYHSIFILKPTLIKILFFLFNIFLFVYVLNNMQFMFFTFDLYDPTAFIKTFSSLSHDEINRKFLLFKEQFVLFSVGTLVMVVIFQLRLFGSFLRSLQKID